MDMMDWPWRGARSAAAAPLVVLMLSAGCALDDRFLGSTPGEDFEVDRDGSGGERGGSGGEKNGDGGTGGETSSTGSQGPGGSTGASGGTGGSGGSGGGQSGGGSTGGGASGGAAPVAPIECEGASGQLTVQGAYANNGELCGFSYTGSWEGASADPPCGQDECFTGSPLCADFLLPGADPEGTNSRGDLGVYPGGFIGLNANQAPSGEEPSYWEVTPTGFFVDYSVGSGEHETVNLQVETIDGRQFCIFDLQPGTVYHTYELTEHCYERDPENARLEPGMRVRSFHLTINSQLGVDSEVTEFCLNDLQFVRGLEADCAGSCSIAQVACGAGYNLSDCLYQCATSTPALYPACATAWATLQACQSQLPLSGFSCEYGLLDAGPDFDCVTEHENFYYYCL